MINWVLIIALTFIFFTPLFLASTSGLISERAGVINIAIEGMMIFGGLGYAVADVYANAGKYTFLVGIAFGMLFAAALAAVHGVVCVLFSGNQIISGVGLNFFAQGFGVTLIYVLRNSTSLYFKNQVYSLPFYSTRVDVTFYMFLILIPLLFVFYYYTKTGLRWRAAGEKPKFLHASGVSVAKYRWMATLISGLFAGAAGAIYIGHIGFFSGTANGWGFLALAILVFSQWKPLGIVLGSFFFAAVLALSNVFQVTQAVENAVPSFVFASLPYVMTVISLVVFSSSSLAPKYAGKHFKKV